MEDNHSTVSILGIGEGAGKIINRIQNHEDTDIRFYALRMQNPESDEQSLPSGYLSIYIVCLDGADSEEYITTVLQQAATKKTKAKLLVVTLPHSSAGTAKRREAFHLLERLEELVDGIYVIDPDSIPRPTIAEELEEVTSRVTEIVRSLVSPVVRPAKTDFGIKDVAEFLRTSGSHKHVEYFTLLGDTNHLKQETKDLSDQFQSNYPSTDDISNMILLVTYNDNTDESAFAYFLKEILLDMMQNMCQEANVKWGLFHDSTMDENVYRIDLLTKSN